MIPKSRYDSVSNYLSKGPNYSGGCCNGTIPSGRRSAEDLFRHPSVEPQFQDAYNDIELVHDKAIYNRLLSEGSSKLYEIILRVRVGMDHHLAKHFAHLFIRDPLVIYAESLQQDDQKSSDHFEVYSRVLFISDCFG